MSAGELVSLVLVGVVVIMALFALLEMFGHM